MPKKSPAASAAKVKKTPVKAKAKPAKTATSPFLFHWLHDTSLESGGPARAFAPGERQLDFLIRANHGTMPQTGHLRVELRLRANIHTQEAMLALAEIKYVGVVDKLHTENQLPQLLADLYPYARSSMESVLALAGHQAPLPATLEAEKVNK